MMIRFGVWLPALCSRVISTLRAAAWREQTDPQPSPSQAQQAAEPGVYALLAGVDRR